ncbi:MAG: hypothetical protein K2J95_08105 [Lachnospiraceae bacterium]|nr:hypothetical protein [Lachnospiraceae bacterium]
MESGGRYFPREKWFNRDNENLTAVSYEYIDDKISFTTVDQNGTVDHCGTVQQDQLILDIHSNINGYEESNREYVFYPFEDIPGWYN